MPSAFLCGRRGCPVLAVQRRKTPPITLSPPRLCRGWAIGSSLIAANISAEQIVGMSGSDCAMGLAISSNGWRHSRCKPWKHSLLAGSIDIRFATLVGATLATAHRISAGHPALRDRFATDEMFTRLRLDPYLRHAGRIHLDLAPLFERPIARSFSLKLVLVHGDISPKNVLDTPTGPVFLDAECAWYGDPSFARAPNLN